MAEQEEASKTIKVTMPNRIHQKLKKLSDESGISMSKLMLLATINEYKLIDDKLTPASLETIAGKGDLSQKDIS